MPVVLDPAPSDTLFPAFNRRREWRAPEVRSHALIVLTETQLVLVRHGEDEPAAEGEGAAQLPDARTVELARLRRLSHDLPSFTLQLECDGGPPQTVQFATAEAADAAFALIWRRLGNGFDLLPPRPDPWEVARVPVAFLAGLLMATLTLTLVVSAAPDLPANALTAALRSADWRVIGGIGGVALALVQAWLYRRLTRPPSHLTLVRRPDTDRP